MKDQPRDDVNAEMFVLDQPNFDSRDQWDGQAKRKYRT